MLLLYLCNSFAVPQCLLYLFHLDSFFIRWTELALDCWRNWNTTDCISYTGQSTNYGDGYILSLWPNHIFHWCPRKPFIMTLNLVSSCSLKICFLVVDGSSIPGIIFEFIPGSMIKSVKISLLFSLTVGK